MSPRREILLRRLEDADPEVRERAAESLDRLDALEGLADVLGRLRSLGKVEWVGLLRSISGLRDETCFKLALKALEHPAPDVRLAALEVTADFADSRAVAHVARLLEDPEALARARAAEVLAQLGDRRSAPRVARLLSDPDQQVVARAAVSLGLLGYGEAEARMLELAEHADPEVRAAAVSALGRLGATDRP